MAGGRRRRVEPAFNAGSFILAALLLIAVVFTGTPTVHDAHTPRPGADHVHR